MTTANLGDGITAEYDAGGRLAGLEVLDATRRFGDPSVLRQVSLEGLRAAIAPRPPSTAAPKGPPPRRC